MNYGEYRRTKPRLNILRGYAGNEPQSITHSAKPKLDEAIKSGMLIVLDTNGEWVKCDTDVPAHIGAVPYFAFQDQSDTDVTSSGLLLGISCLGEFELQTAYFDTAAVWVNGSPVVKSATAGSVAMGATALAAVEVLGFASRSGMEDIGAINSEATSMTSIPPGTAGAHMYVLNLVTSWRPKTA